MSSERIKTQTKERGRQRATEGERHRTKTEREGESNQSGFFCISVAIIMDDGGNQQNYPILFICI